MDDEEDKEDEVEIKKTYNTRYAKREIKKVNYNEDIEDELFSFENEFEDENDDDDEEEEDEEEDDDYEEGNENDESLQEDSLLLDNVPKLINTESSDEEKLPTKTVKKNGNNNNELNEKENDNIMDVENVITEEYEPKISIDKKNNKRSEKTIEKTKEKAVKIYDSDSDEYIKSDSNDDSSDDSSSYEEMMRKRSSAKKKRPKKYKKRKNTNIDDSLFMDDSDSEREELRNKEIKKLVSTEHGYLGPLPKIKSKVVIEEEKKLFEEMKRRAGDLNSDLDIVNTNPEYVSVTNLLRKRKKESDHNEFNVSPKRISLDSNKSGNFDNMDYENQRIKTPITIQKIKEEKDFTIVKVLNTVDNSSSKKPLNLLGSISKQKIENILKNTPIKLIEKNQTYIKNTPLNISEEDLNDNNLFMIDDDANLDLLKEKIIEILMENGKIENNNSDFMDIDENQLKPNNDIVEIVNENEENDENRRISQIKNEISQLKISSSKQIEEHEEELKDEEAVNTKKKELYEIKSSDKKILKELSFSITTPEPNPSNVNSTSKKTNDKTFKTPLSSHVNNFYLSSDISLDETVDALLSTPTPLPQGLKNDKESLIRSNIFLLDIINNYKNSKKRKQ